MLYVPNVNVFFLKKPQKPTCFTHSSQSAAPSSYSRQKPRFSLALEAKASAGTTYLVKV